MAINKISKGRGFAGVFNYVLRPSKRPYIIGKCAIHNDPHNLAIEFQKVANLRPTVQTHIPQVRSQNLVFLKDGKK